MSWYYLSAKWVSLGRTAYTSRLRVPGGWLYREREGGELALAFVPEPVPNLATEFAKEKAGE